MEKEQSLEELHAKRQCFVQKAIEEGAHEKIREKTVNIGAAYVFGDSSLREIADSYGETRANAQQLYPSFLNRLFRNSSEQTRSLYTREFLLVRKPTPQGLRERNSESHGGKSLKIRDLINSGAETVEELEMRSGFSRDSIVGALSVIEGWGVDISRFFSIVIKNQEKIEQLRKEEDDKKIQEILDELPAWLILSNIVKYKLKRKKETDGTFITIGDLTSGVFHYKSTATGLFFDSLSLSRVPIRRMETVRRKTGRTPVYYVLLERHRERALGVLEEDPRLRRYKENPVKIICGQSTDSLPTLYQVQHSGYFRSIGSLFKEMGIPISRNRGSGLHCSDFLTSECPIPVYQYQRSSSKNYYFPEKYAGALKNFLRNRYQNLRKSTAD